VLLNNRITSLLSTDLLTNQSTNSMDQSPSWEAVDTQLVKKLPVLVYSTRRFITVITRFNHWSLTWASWIHSIISHLTSLRSILIYLHLQLGLPSGLFPSGFPIKILYPFLISPVLNLGGRGRNWLWYAELLSYLLWKIVYTRSEVVDRCLLNEANFFVLTLTSLLLIGNEALN
jgi:hypothetical protein